MKFKENEIVPTAVNRKQGELRKLRKYRNFKIDGKLIIEA